MLRKMMLRVALRGVRSSRRKLAEFDQSLSQFSFWLKAHEIMLRTEELNQKMRERRDLDDLDDEDDLEPVG